MANVSEGRGWKVERARSKLGGASRRPSAEDGERATNGQTFRAVRYGIMLSTAAVRTLDNFRAV
ncbi:hypothetical protein GJ744_007587 [Endocarpon pusillum]|uniref:Uncharacterized protein n=1 Tax=Endocarpon pusillum TaxID=364733 RepID=A0A8H7AMD6_9EURO|nr:hypothetical protein GJ744_007587 [Endocarpon pusillum]